MNIKKKTQKKQLSSSNITNTRIDAECNTICRMCTYFFLLFCDSEQKTENYIYFLHCTLKHAKIKEDIILKIIDIFSRHDVSCPFHFYYVNRLDNFI